MPEEASVYHSKRDWWIMALLWLCLVMMVVGFVSALTEPVAPSMRVFAACFFAFFGLLMVWLIILAYRTCYILDSDSLTIQAGPFKSGVPLADITEVFPTHNPLSAPAWSLDRIRIRYRSSRFGALISPERPRQFLAELEALAPQLVMRGEGLVLDDG